MIDFDLKPFDETKFEEILYPGNYNIYSDFRICILDIYYRRFSNKYHLETEIVRDDYINIINHTPISNDFDDMAKELIFLVLQNTNWDVLYLSFDDYNQEEKIEDYIKRKNKTLHKLIPYIEEQIWEVTCDFQNVLYCISNAKIGRYLKEKNNGMLHPYDKEIMDNINNLHPLYYQNSWFAEEMDGIYYVIFSIGWVWDYPITFYQIHPNFYTRAYKLDLMLDEVFQERE